MHDKNQTIFLVTGAPRSGTTFLQNVLNTHSNVACLHEFQLTRLDRIVQELFYAEDERNRFLENRDRLLAQRMTDGSGEDSSTKSYLSSEKYEKAILDRETMIERAIGTSTLRPERKRHHSKIIETLFGTVSGKSRLSAVGDKEPNIRSRAVVDDLRRRFPGLKIIYLLRNPIDVVRSSMHRVVATQNDHDNWPITSLREALDEWVLNWEHAASERQRADPNDMFIRYEGIIGNFDTGAQSLAEFLGVKRTRFFGLGRGFVNVASAIPQKLSDFSLTDAQENEVRACVGKLDAAWPDHGLDELLASFGELHPEFEPGSIFDHRSPVGPAGVFRTGFSVMEPWGVWTEGQHARVCFGVKASKPGEKYRVNVDLARYDAGRNNLEFEIRIPGMPAQAISIPRDARQEVEFDCVATHGKLDFSFYIPHPKRQSDEPMDEPRALGLGVTKIDIAQVRGSSAQRNEGDLEAFRQGRNNQRRTAGS